MYISKSDGANFWLGVLTDLQNRGVQDILIACVDGLKGFPDAIASVFPQTTVQLCIVHQIRNSVKYVASKNRKEFMRDQKLVYQAVNKDAAEKALDDLEIKAYLHLILLLKSLSISHLRESGRNGRSRCRTGDRRPSNWHPKAVIAIFNKFPQAVNR